MKGLWLEGGNLDVSPKTLSLVGVFTWPVDLAIKGPATNHDYKRDQTPDENKFVGMNELRIWLRNLFGHSIILWPQNDHWQMN